MKVLIVGSGGREHTLAWKISRSKRVNKIFAAPGNGGLEEIAECVPIDASDIRSLAEFAFNNGIDLTIVGPEVPLAMGIVDVFKEKGLRVFGPDKKAAQIEGSKIWAKDFMLENKIPTAGYKVFSDKKEAISYSKNKKYPLVIKADGLAAGKGVIICKDRNEAESALNDLMEKKTLGEAGLNIIVEEFIEGEELSIIALTDGEAILPLSSAQDYKKINAGDEGPNTGGMGSYSPVVFWEKELEKKIYERIMFPTLNGFKEKGIEYCGILYFGIIISGGEPYVLEYNCRFGDPETQAILPRLREDLVELIEVVERKGLSEWMEKNNLSWDSRYAICVAVASSGYPGKYEKGKEIFGLENMKTLKDTYVFHAGTAKKDGKCFTNGGRVLGVTALGTPLKDAQGKANEAIKNINFENMYYRKDIGWRGLK